MFRQVNTIRLHNKHRLWNQRLQSHVRGPTGLLAPSAIEAMRTDLPKAIGVAAFGEILPENMAAYFDIGVNGFGLGPALFNPYYSMSELQERAIKLVGPIYKLRNR